MDHSQAGTLIATLLLARDMAHRAHLKVEGAGAYAKHVALGEFYDGIVGLVDELAEAYQGRFDVLLDIPLLAAPDEDDIELALMAQREWIRDMRYEAVPSDESPLQNIIDEIEALYMKTNYKLKRLR